MMFPFIETEEEEELDELENEEEELQLLPREYGLNFETGQLTGKVVEGADAVAVWAWLALQTAKERFYIYSLDYGQDYEEMMGKGYSKAYIDMELKRMTEECLEQNPYVTGIEQFSCTLEEDQAHLVFTILTDFGESEEVELFV